MTDWQGRPAIGIALAKLVELHTRLVRLDAKRKEQRAERVLSLMHKVER